MIPRNRIIQRYRILPPTIPTAGGLPDFALATFNTGYPAEQPTKWMSGKENFAAGPARSPMKPSNIGPA
jgi:hypothetical protein